MYTIDERDRVVELHTLPQSCAGAPLPMVVSDELVTLVAYLVQQRDPNWDGTTCRVVDALTEMDTVAIVRCRHAYSIMFGPPNDEAFSGHPLAARGLAPYGTFQVLESSWIRRLEQMNSVHQYHDPARFQQLSHFVLSFHDSTFECIAEALELIDSSCSSMAQAAQRMLQLVTNPK